MGKILHLTLKKKWFDLIASGKKKIEYREFKRYWVSRLRFTEFDEIHFHNGYGKNAPLVRVEFKGRELIHSSSHSPANGEKLNGTYYALKLGRVLEVRNGPVV